MRGTVAVVSIPRFWIGGARIGQVHSVRVCGQLSLELVNNQPEVASMGDHGTYQARFVPARQGRELVVGLGQLEIAFDIRGRDSVFVLQGFSVLLTRKQILGCRKRFQARGIVEARGVGAELRAQAGGWHRIAVNAGRQVSMVNVKLRLVERGVSEVNAEHIKQVTQQKSQTVCVLVSVSGNSHERKAGG